MELLWILLLGVLLALAALLPAAALQVQMNRRLVEAKDQFKRTSARLEAESLDARFTVDLYGNVVSYNHRAQQAFGFHSSEIIGKSVDKLLHVPRNVLPAGVVDALYRSKRSEDKQALEVIGCRKDGSYFPLELHISESGGYMRRKFHMTARDLSERQQGADATRELRVLEAMLHCSAAPTLILNREGQIERHNLMFEKLSGYSHEEIRKRPFWDLLLEPGEREHARLELQRMIARAGTGGQRMMWRMRSGGHREFLVAAAGVPLHEFRTPDDLPMEAAAILVAFPIHQNRELEEGDALEGFQAMNLSSFTLDEALSGLHPLLNRLLGERIAISIHSSGEGSEVTADRHTLEHLVLTALLNARDAMPDGGKLTLETSAVHLDKHTAQRAARLSEGHYGVVTITQSGTRREPWRPAEMAAPMEAMRKQGGNVVVQSTAGAGSTLRIYLPAPAPRGLFVVKTAAG